MRAMRSGEVAFLGGAGTKEPLVLEGNLISDEGTFYGPAGGGVALKEGREGGGGGSAVVDDVGNREGGGRALGGHAGEDLAFETKIEILHLALADGAGLGLELVAHRETIRPWS